MSSSYALQFQEMAHKKEQISKNQETLMAIHKWHQPGGCKGVEQELVSKAKSSLIYGVITEKQAAKYVTPDPVRIRVDGLWWKRDCDCDGGSDRPCDRGQVLVQGPGLVTGAWSCYGLFGLWLAEFGSERLVEITVLLFCDWNYC